MKLYYAPQSPFARKVRAAAIELGLEQEMRLVYAEVVPGTPNRAFGSSVNPLRKIPALVTDDGLVLYDSSVIVEYLNELAAGDLIPRHGRARWRVLRNHALAQGMCEAVVLLRYETWLRPAGLRWVDWTTDQRARSGPGSRGSMKTRTS